MNSSLQIFDLLLILIGVYMVYSAVSGKGSFYRDDNIKEGRKEKYRKLVRWFCLFGGPIAIASSVFDFLKIQLVSTILFILLGVILVCVVVVIITFTKPRK
jgi:hypothetical protein